MADLKTQLEIGVDASSVDPSLNKIKKSITDLGEAAAAAGQKGGDSFELLANSADDAAKKTNAATRRLIADAQRSFALLQSGGAAGPRNTGSFLETRAAQIGADRDVIKRYAQALDDVAFAKNRATQASLGLNKAFDYTALSAKQTTAALRQVPSQLTDIIVSLQGGQAPLTVLLQQGGQLKDVFGGIGPAARALGGYIAGLVNPFTLAAAAAAALAVAYNQGSKEADAYAKALILTGNAAGTNINQLNAMAKAVSNVTGTQAEAADAVAQFAANGNIAANSIERFSRVAVQLERTTGQAIGDTVKQFAELGKEPLQASIKLNETTRFLTNSLYQQIKALDEQGRTAEAAAVAQRGFAEAMESRTGQLEARLGSIERGWRAVKDAASEAWSAMLNVGRADTLNDQLDRARARLQQAEAGQRSIGGRLLPTSGGEVDAARQEVTNLNRRIFLEGELAERQAASAKQIAARVEADKDGLKYQSESAKLAIEIVRQTNVLREAGANPQEIAARIAAIKASAEKQTPKGPRDPQRGLDRSELAFDLSKIRAEADELVRIYSDAERVLSALRSGGLVDERGYYESRRQFIELETQARERAFQQEIDRLQQEKFNSKDKIQNERDELDNKRKIAEAEAKLAILRSSASSKAVLLELEEKRAIKEKEDALISARQAAEDYLSSQDRQQNRTLQAFGQGPREAAFAAGVNQIDENFSQQERELKNLKDLGKLTEEQYQKRLSIIREFQQKSIQSFTEYYNRLIELQSNATVGATQAVKTYIDQAANVAQSTDQFVTNTLSGLEDSLTKFLTTGKSSFKEFANAIVSDITRIIIKQQIANALAGQIGSQSGGGDFISGLFNALMGSKTPSVMSSGAFGIGVSGFAMGGQVERGRIVEVNESNGPGELFNVGNRQYLLASQSGQISPQKAATQQNGQAMTVIQNFMLSAPADRRTQAQIANAAGQGVQRAMARNS